MKVDIATAKIKADISTTKVDEPEGESEVILASRKEMEKSESVPRGTAFQRRTKLSKKLQAIAAQQWKVASGKNIFVGLLILKISILNMLDIAQKLIKKMPQKFNFLTGNLISV